MTEETSVNICDICGKKIKIKLMVAKTGQVICTDCIVNNVVSDFPKDKEVSEKE